jgi:hypothetical protein
MANDPIEECWSEIRPSRDLVPEEIPETQIITCDTETSGLSTKNKEELCERIARRLIGDTQNWTLIEDQALNFMTMTDEAVLETAHRIGIRLVVTTPNSRAREQELINELNAKLHY